MVVTFLGSWNAFLHSSFLSFICHFGTVHGHGSIAAYCANFCETVGQFSVASRVTWSEREDSYTYLFGRRQQGTGQFDMRLCSPIDIRSSWEAMCYWEMLLAVPAS